MAISVVFNLNNRFNNRELGALGENLVISILKEKGCAILQQNFRSRYGEIDIVAKDRGSIVFIEVKTRRSTRYGTPEEAVDLRKQKQLRLMAAYYLSNHHTTYAGYRFDVYSIFLNKDNQPESIKVLENCF